MLERRSAEHGLGSTTSRYRDLLARSAWIFGGGWKESLRASAQNAWNTAWSGTLCSSSPGSGNGTARPANGSPPAKHDAGCAPAQVQPGRSGQRHTAVPSRHAACARGSCRHEQPCPAHPDASSARDPGSDPGRTLVGMAAQRLDAAQREHEASAGIAPVGPNAMVRAMSNALVILPAAPMRMRSRRSRPTRVLCTSSSASCIGTPT